MTNDYFGNALIICDACIRLWSMMVCLCFSICPYRNAMYFSICASYVLYFFSHFVPSIEHCFTVMCSKLFYMRLEYVLYEPRSCSGSFQ
jgi:hypothetical protein